MITQHARRRMQQRSIDPLVVDCLFRFGHMRYDHRGGIKYYFDKQSWRDMEREFGRRAVARLSPLLDDAYAVSTTDVAKLVTLGHRDRRFNRG